MKNSHYQMARIGALLAILIVLFPQKTRAQQEVPAPSTQELILQLLRARLTQDSAQEPLPDESSTSTLGDPDPPVRE